MNQLAEKSRFVKPYFIKELGQEGLTLTDIARSLDQEPRNFRSNFKRSFEDRCKTLNLLTASIEAVHPVNGSVIQEIAVSVDCAKWLVAKSNTEEGDAYTAYLIGLEHQVNEIERLATKDPLLAAMLQTQALRVKQLEQEEIIKTLQVESAQHAKAIASITAASNYVTAMGFLKTKHKSVSNADALRLGKRASKLCREGGVKIDTIHSEVHGKVNTYPEDVLETAYNNLKDEEI